MTTQSRRAGLRVKHIAMSLDLNQATSSRLSLFSTQAPSRIQEVKGLLHTFKTQE
jgi:hypothetical protein